MRATVGLLLTWALVLVPVAVMLVTLYDHVAAVVK